MQISLFRKIRVKTRVKKINPWSFMSLYRWLCVTIKKNNCREKIPVVPHKYTKANFSMTKRVCWQQERITNSAEEYKRHDILAAHPMRLSAKWLYCGWSYIGISPTSYFKYIWLYWTHVERFFYIVLCYLIQYLQ